MRSSSAISVWLARTDSTPISVVSLARATPEEIRRATGVSAPVARALVEGRKGLPLTSVWSLGTLPRLAQVDRERIVRRALLQGDTRIAITDVQPAAGRIMSGKPFALRVSFAAEQALLDRACDRLAAAAATLS